jgi:hypothetical protein
MSHWKNVSGTCCIEEVCLKDGRWGVEKRVKGKEEYEHKPLPESAQEAIKEAFPEATDEEGLTIDIAFLASGYYSRGRVSGPPEDCYPDEGEEERVRDGGIKVTVGDAEVVLEGKAADELFDHFSEEVDEVELDTRDDDFDPPDRDDDY